MIFCSSITNVMFMSTVSSLAQLDSEIICQCFPTTYDLNGFKCRTDNNDTLKCALVAFE